MKNGITESRSVNPVVNTTMTSQLNVEFFKKSHELVFSRMDLGARELDLMGLFLARLRSEQWESFKDGKSVKPPVYHFEGAVLCEWFNVASKHLYDTLNPVSSRLTQKTVGIQNEDTQSFDYISLFSRIRYEKGVLEIIPNGELMDVYLGVSKGHSHINHKVYRTLKSEYSKKLYSIFSRFKTLGSLHEQDLDSLKGLLGLLDEKGKLKKAGYAKVSRFLDVCIRKPIEEIASKDPLIKFHYDSSGSYGFKKIRRLSRKITHLEFLFEWVDEADNVQKLNSRELTASQETQNSSEKKPSYYAQMMLLLQQPQTTIEDFLCYSKADFFQLIANHQKWNIEIDTNVSIKMMGILDELPYE